MKPYLFYNGSKLFCAMLPDGEYSSLRSDSRSWEDFNEAKEHGIANALPVSNEEVFELFASRSVGDNNDKELLLPGTEYNVIEFLRWPGMVVKELFDDGDDRFITEMYRLIPPKYNLEDKMFIEENKE